MCGTWRQRFLRALIHTAIVLGAATGGSAWAGTISISIQPGGSTSGMVMFWGAPAALTTAGPDQQPVLSWTVPALASQVPWPAVTGLQGANWSLTGWGNANWGGQSELWMLVEWQVPENFVVPGVFARNSLWQRLEDDPLVPVEEPPTRVLCASVIPVLILLWFRRRRRDRPLPATRAQPASRA